MATQEFDLSCLLHPAGAFAHPDDVLRDPDLTLNEKRSILASWASDACAVDSAPGLRMNALGKPVSWDEIMDALRSLDRQATAGFRAPPRYKRVLAMKDSGRLAPKKGDQRMPRSRLDRDDGDPGETELARL